MTNQCTSRTTDPDTNHGGIVLEMSIQEEGYDFSSSISSALEHAEIELQDIKESIDSLNNLRADCDKLDYALAASIGALCGIIDIFLVGTPGESDFGQATDKWFETITIKFAEFLHPDKKKEFTIKNAISYLEGRFKIPYDQTSWGEAGKYVFGNLNTNNHHFKSLAHNPSLCGLFFSILDQWNNTSHFISDGQLVALVEAKDGWELKGGNLPAKLFCGFVNWFGHLMSDNSGSSGSAGRGTGIPSPLWTWTNDIIAIKAKLHIPVNRFDKSVNELALTIFNQGYDTRFQTAQAIPVFVNELLVRLFYSIRRFIHYIANEDNVFSFQLIWKSCEPFSNPTVKRMLTVSHGTFCMLDLADATIRGVTSLPGTFNAPEFFLRLNIIGLGRFAVSLYGEAQRELRYKKSEQDATYARKELTIVEYYIQGLKILQEKYNDKELLSFTEDLQNSDMYINAFQKTTQLAELRNVPEAKILRSKKDIDNYFMGVKV